MFKIPTDDGDSPACFEARNGLMPVGVCANRERRPEPSRGLGLSLLTNLLHIAHFQELDRFLDRTHCEGRLGGYMIVLLPSSSSFS